MSHIDQTDKLNELTISSKNPYQEFFRQFRRKSSPSIMPSRYWRQMIHRELYEPNPHLDRTLSQINSDAERIIAYQAFWLSSGNHKYLSMLPEKFRLNPLVFVKGRWEQNTSTIQLDIKSKIIKVLIKHHQEFFERVESIHFKERPLHFDRIITWDQIKQDSKLLSHEQIECHDGLRYFTYVIGDQKDEFRFYLTDHNEFQAFFHKPDRRFYLGRNFLKYGKSNHIFHLLCLEWRLMHEDLWMLYRFSCKEIYENLKKWYGKNINVNLHPHLFPEYYQEFTSFEFPTHFEFLNPRKNPFQLSIADFIHCKEHLVNQIHYAQVNDTLDLIGLAEIVISKDFSSSSNVEIRQTFEKMPALQNLVKLASKIRI